jgi:hypothetical protein
VLRGEVTNTNVIIFGLTRRGLEPTIYRTPGEHANYYTTDAVVFSDKVYQLLAHGRWFSLGTPASSTTKTGRHDIAEIVLKVALSTNDQINQQSFIISKM